MVSPLELLSPPPGTTPQAAPASMEERIAERIRDFDLPALMDVLATAGYTRSEIEFRSHRTLVSHGHLVHAIHFERQPRRRVVVTVNLGLLSVQSPLPSFLFKAMDQTDHDSLEDFLAYFDHHLLRARFAGLCPERDESLLGGREAAEDRLRLLRLSCPSSLHWLFARVFPEGEVRVRRTTEQQPMPAPGLRLGASTLGSGAAVGGFATVARGGLDVALLFSEPSSGTGTPWAVEAPRRFETHILPRLADTTLFLTVALVLRNHSSQAALGRHKYLAYEPMGDESERDHIVPFFSGDTAQAARSLRAAAEKGGRT